MSAKVKVILMSYNRSNCIVEAIDSILRQNYSNINFIVSDNSTNDEAQSLIQKKYPQIPIIRRKPSGSMVDHLNQLVSEADGDYFMMFHDDDIMQPNCIETLVQVMENNPEAIACCGNAKIIKGEVVTDKLHNTNVLRTITFKSVFELGQRYFNASLGGVNPFPGYMYRTSLVGNTKFDEKDAGKHSDVAFLFKLLNKGSIIWIPNVTLHYRIHDSNISVGVDILSLSNLVNFYRKSANVLNDQYSKEFLMKNYIIWLKENRFFHFMKKHPYRFRVIIHALISFFMRSPIRFLIIVKKYLSK